MGTDDIAFLTAGHTPTATDVVAWRERLALRHDAAIALGHMGGTALVPRNKTGWFPEELTTMWIPRATPELLAFTAVNSAARTTVAPVRAHEALSRLMQCSPWVALEAEFADEHLALMTRLVLQTRAFSVSLGRDLFDRPDLLLELVA